MCLSAIQIPMSGLDAGKQHWIYGIVSLVSTYQLNKAIDILIDDESCYETKDESKPIISIHILPTIGSLHLHKQLQVMFNASDKNGIFFFFFFFFFF